MYQGGVGCSWCMHYAQVMFLYASPSPQADIRGVPRDIGARAACARLLRLRSQAWARLALRGEIAQHRNLHHLLFGGTMRGKSAGDTGAGP